MFKIKTKLLFIFSFVLLFSCKEDYTPIEMFEYSEKIIGEWKQVSTYRALNDPTKPIPGIEWYDVEDGFTLILNEDGRFEYTKYEDCISGQYIFNADSGRIDFNFDCRIDLNGESISTLIETFSKEPYSNNYLSMRHLSIENCQDECGSNLERVF